MSDRDWTDDVERDARFARAVSLYQSDMTRQELNSLRRSAGTLAPISRWLGDGQSRISRFLWWLFDVNYVRF
jgi:hypothetical protein